MRSLIPCLACGAALLVALPAGAAQTIHVTTRTLGQTGVHQFELEFRAPVAALEVLDTPSLDWTPLDTPLPQLQPQRLWTTLDHEGSRTLSLLFEAEAPWVDTLVAAPPGALEGTVVPEPEVFAGALALGVLAWVGFVQHRRRFALQRAS